VCGQYVQNFGEAAGLSLTSTDDIGKVATETTIVQNFFRVVGLIHDHPQDAEVGGIGDVKGADADAMLAEQAQAS